MPTVAVGAIAIERSQGAEPRVLLVQRLRPPNQGHWSLPGGKVEPREDLVHAVTREVMEETGLCVCVGDLVEVVRVMDEAFDYVILDYACEITGGKLRPGDDAQRAELVLVSELTQYNVTLDLLRVVSKALAGLER